MVLYESALYQGKIWCSYAIKKPNGDYDEDYRLKMRKESQKGSFTCPVCHEPMVLCAGPIMEPYFRHLRDLACEREDSVPGRRDRRARSLLYVFLANSFPKTQIKPNARQTFHGERDVVLSCDFLTETDESNQIALHYLTHDWKLSEWEEAHMIYESTGVFDVWIFSSQYLKTEKMTTFEYLVKKSTGSLIYLDSEKRELLISTCFSWKEERKEISRWRGKLELATLTPEGNIGGEFGSFRRKWELEVEKRHNIKRKRDEKKEWKQYQDSQKAVQSGIGESSEYVQLSLFEDKD